MNRSAIVVCSGGLDSVTLAHWVLREVNPSRLCLLFFRYGQKQESQEWNAVEDCFRDLWKISPNVVFVTEEIRGVLSGFGSKDEYVPARNFLFAAHALNFAERNEYDDIYFGFIDPEKPEEDRYWDTTETFLMGLNATIGEKSGKKFYAPLLESTKKDVFQFFKDYQLDIDSTWSCMHPTSDGKPCGSCQNCISRFYFKHNMWEEYLQLNGIPNEQYIQNYINAPTINEARLLINNKCNMRCGHCFYGHEELQGEEMSEENWKKVIEKCVKAGVTNFHFGGKEPFFDDKIFSIIDELKKYDVTYDVVTNGVNVARYIEQIKQAGFWRICLSVDSFHYGEKDGVVQLLLENEIPVDIFTVVSKENENEIVDMYQKYMEMGVSGFYIHPLYMYGNAVGKEEMLVSSEQYLNIFNALVMRKVLNQDDCTIDFSLLGRYLQEMCSLSTDFANFVVKSYTTGDSEILPNFHLLAHSHCVRFSSTVTIMPDGEVLGCGSDVSVEEYKTLSAGNILSPDSLMDIVKRGRKQVDFSFSPNSTLFCLHECPNLKPPCK